MQARQSQTQKLQLFSVFKVARACVLDPRKYDNDKFWEQVYVFGLDVENIERTIRMCPFPLEVEHAFPALDTLKANIKLFCQNPELVLRIIENCKIDFVLETRLV